MKNYKLLLKEIRKYLKEGPRYDSKDLGILLLKRKSKIFYESLIEYPIPVIEGERLQEIICKVRSRLLDLDFNLEDRPLLILSGFLVSVGIKAKLFDMKYYLADGYYKVSRGNGIILDKRIAPLDTIQNGSRKILGGRLNQHNQAIRFDLLAYLSAIPYKVASNKPDRLVDLSNMKSYSDRKIAETILEQERIARQEFSLDTVFFNHAFDKRGRVYCKESLISYQSYEENKAILSFAREKELTDRGWYWFKIAIADAFGLDKETFDKRVEWFNTNLKAILGSQLDDQAKEKHLYCQAVKAYREALKTGKTGYIARLDATCSGIQLMSVIMRDKELMTRLNVLPSSKRYDFYTLVTEEMNRLGSKTVFDREDVKAATMTKFYNSEAKPKEIFGKDISLFYKALDNIASSATACQETINDCWDNSREENSWYLPDGHYSFCPVTDMKKHKIEIEGFYGRKVSTIVILPIQAPNPDHHRSLSANVIHSLDAWICRRIIEACQEANVDVSPIHDSFGIHPNDCDLIRTVFRGCLSRLYRENILEDILSQVTEEDIVIEARGEYDPLVEKSIRDNFDGYYIC